MVCLGPPGRQEHRGPLALLDQQGHKARREHLVPPVLRGQREPLARGGQPGCRGRLAPLARPAHKARQGRLVLPALRARREPLAHGDRQAPPELRVPLAPSDRQVPPAPV